MNRAAGNVQVRSFDFATHFNYFGEPRRRTCCCLCSDEPSEQPERKEEQRMRHARYNCCSDLIPCPIPCCETTPFTRSAAIRKCVICMCLAGIVQCGSIVTYTFFELDQTAYELRTQAAMYTIIVFLASLLILFHVDTLYHKTRLVSNTIALIAASVYAILVGGVSFGVSSSTYFIIARNEPSAAVTYSTSMMFMSSVFIVSSCIAVLSVLLAWYHYWCAAGSKEMKAEFVLHDKDTYRDYIKVCQLAMQLKTPLSDMIVDSEDQPRQPDVLATVDLRRSAGRTNQEAYHDVRHIAPMIARQSPSSVSRRFSFSRQSTMSGTSNTDRRMREDILPRNTTQEVLIAESKRAEYFDADNIV